MQDPIELFRHNTWTNSRVFDLAAGLDEPYLATAEGPAPRSRQEVEAWAAHELSCFPEQVRDVGRRFLGLLESSTPESLDAPLNVPWFCFHSI